MSSETSTKQVRLTPDPSAAPADAGLQPWQFFVLAALGCATAVTFMARGEGPTAVILLGVLMGTAALIGYAALRALLPLVSPEEDRTVMVGQRTRVALEREKQMTLRSIKELEFDRAMGRLSDEDWSEMSGRLRARAGRLMRQLDAGAGVRDQIEKDLAKRIGDGDARLKPSRYDSGADSRSAAERDADRSAKASAERDIDRSAKASPERDDDRSATLREPQDRPGQGRGPKALAERRCAACETVNDADAKFCKGCGARL